MCDDKALIEIEGMAVIVDAYHVIDATDEAQLLALGTRRFDAAVCTMGITEIPPVLIARMRLTR